MNELNEINLRREQKAWQTKQDSSGMLAMVMCMATVGGFLYFASAPSGMSAGMLAVLMVGMLVACGRMVGCAAKVVQTEQVLQPIRARAEVIDVEVVEVHRENSKRLLTYV